MFLLLLSVPSTVIFCQWVTQKNLWDYWSTLTWPWDLTFCSIGSSLRVWRLWSGVLELVHSQNLNKHSTYIHTTHKRKMCAVQLYPMGYKLIVSTPRIADSLTCTKVDPGVCIWKTSSMVSSAKLHFLRYSRGESYMIEGSFWRRPCIPNLFCCCYIRLSLWRPGDEKFPRNFLTPHPRPPHWSPPTLNSTRIKTKLLP